MSASSPSAAGPRGLAAAGIAVVAFAAGLWLAWTAAATLLLIFSGLLSPSSSTG